MCNRVAPPTPITVHSGLAMVRADHDHISVVNGLQGRPVDAPPLSQHFLASELDQDNRHRCPLPSHAYPGTDPEHSRLI